MQTKTASMVKFSCFSVQKLQDGLLSLHLKNKDKKMWLNSVCNLIYGLRWVGSVWKQEWLLCADALLGQAAWYLTNVKKASNDLKKIYAVAL